MTTCRPWFTAALLAVGWLAGFGSVSASASEIHDEGKFFSPDVVTKATEDLNQLEKRSKLETRIETFETIPAEKREAFDKLTTKEEKDKFYANWMLERTKAEHAHGVFLLMTRNPSHLLVEPSNSLRKRGFTSAQRNELRDLLVSNFKEKKFDDGLKAFVTQLEADALRLNAYVPPAGAPVARQNAALHQQQINRPPVQPAARGGMGIMGWIILAIVVWVVFMIISALIRGASGYGPRGPGYGPAGYGPGGGYGPGYGYGGGYGGSGGFFSNMLGGLAGAMAGNWLYDSMGSHSHGNQANAGWTNTDTSGDNSYAAGNDFGGGGGDFGDSGGNDFGGGDFGGGGGDFGGGDFGGGGGGDGGGDF